MKSWFPCILTISLCMQPLPPPITLPRVWLGISTVSDEIIVISQITFVQGNSQFLNSLWFSFLFLQFLFRILLLKKNKKIHRLSCMVLDMSELKANFYLFHFYQFIFFFFFLKKWRNSVTNSHASTINLRSNSSIPTVVPKKKILK